MGFYGDVKRKVSEMGITNKKLFKILIDRDMMKKDLAGAADCQ